MINSIIFYFTAIACFIFNSSAALYAESDYNNVYIFAQKLKTCITAKDIPCIIEHLSEEVVLSDDNLNKSDVEKLLHNKNSWLHESIFTGDDSIKNHLESPEEVEIYIHQDVNIFQIVYKSTNSKKLLPPVFTIAIEDNKCIILDIFND